MRNGLWDQTAIWNQYLESGGREVDHNFANLGSDGGPDKGADYCAPFSETGLGGGGGGGNCLSVSVCLSACLSSTNDGWILIKFNF